MNRTHNMASLVRGPLSLRIGDDALEMHFFGESCRGYLLVHPLYTTGSQDCALCTVWALERLRSTNADRVFESTTLNPHVRFICNHIILHSVRADLAELV